MTIRSIFSCLSQLFWHKMLHSFSEKYSPILALLNAHVWISQVLEVGHPDVRQLTLEILTPGTS